MSHSHLRGSPACWIASHCERPRDQLKQRTPNEPDPTRIEERVPRDIQTQKYGEADGDLEMTDDLDIGQSAEVIVEDFVDIVNEDAMQTDDSHMSVMVDVLQCLGVEPDVATRYAVHAIKTSAMPTFTNVWPRADD